jgi:asparagine synthase (glutamine-hydrolysing)
MLGALKLYGPHASDRLDLGEAALGRCLFRSLPEDVHDDQPIEGGGARWVMVADVRLDNRDELVAALGLPGPQAAAMADSAIAFAAWERWQEGCFERLLGDFAIAVWDRDARRLVLARDVLGTRPLYYHRARGLVAFASMAKGLHALPEIPRAPDEDRVANEIALMPEQGAQSFFAGIDRVEPGHFVALSAETTTPRRYWDPKPSSQRLAGPEAYAEALRAHLDSAVKARLRGVGNAVGAHLSAGFDSSAVATSAAAEMAVRGGRVVAFTAAPREGYDGPVPRNRFGDEAPIAAMTAALHANIDHVVLRGSGRSPLANLDRHFYLFERPILNLCNKVWSDAINDAARGRGLRVLLTGQMGNMTLSYDGITLLPQLIRSGHWLRWLHEGRALMRSSTMRKRGLLALSLGPYIPSAAWAWLNKSARGETEGLEAYSMLSPNVDRERIAARARERALDLNYRPRKDGFETRMWALRRMDPGNYNKGILGGWGLDARDPTGDRRLIEFCLSVPEDQYLREGDTKALARRAFASRLPAELIANRDKGLQAIDWHEGLTAARDALREEIARIGACSGAAQTLDIARMAELACDLPTGGWDQGDVMRRYRLGLLRGISSGHFLRKASGGNG